MGTATAGCSGIDQLLIDDHGGVCGVVLLIEAHAVPDLAANDRFVLLSTVTLSFFISTRSRLGRQQSCVRSEKQSCPRKKCQSRPLLLKSQMPTNYSANSLWVGETSIPDVTVFPGAPLLIKR